MIILCSIVGVAMDQTEPMTIYIVCESVWTELFFIIETDIILHMSERGILN